MFFYLYDSFVLEKKHEGTLTRIENRIIELGINGRVEKLTALRNMKELLEDAVKQEAHTIVIVGDDVTFVKAVNILATHKVAIGYVPFGEESVLAKLFGISDTFEACNILSRRITKQVDLAKANQNYFLTAATINQANGLTINCNDEFTVSFPKHNVSIQIENLGDVFGDSFKPGFDVNQVLPAQKKQLVLTMSEQIKRSRLFSSPKVGAQHVTRLPIRKAVFNHEQDPIALQLDGGTIIKTPVTITLKQKQIKIIVGKQRLI